MMCHKDDIPPLTLAPPCTLQKKYFSMLSTDSEPSAGVTSRGRSNLSFLEQQYPPIMKKKIYIIMIILILMIMLMIIIVIAIMIIVITIIMIIILLITIF